MGEHQETGGPLQPEPMQRALETIDLFAHFCRATGIERVRPLATSAIREASNRKAFVRAARKRAGLDVEVLTREQEARYGYLAVVNSTTLTDGVALDIGGGSMQLTHVVDRASRDARSWRLGAVVTTERFLAAERVKPKHLKALREHVRRELAEAEWLGDSDGRLAGIGGTVRNLAAAVMIERGPALVRRPGLPPGACGARCAGRAAGRTVARAAEPRGGHQARARRPDPRRRRRRPDRDGGGRVRGARGDRGGLAGGRVLRGAAGRAGLAAAGRRARLLGAQPRRPVPRRHPRTRRTWCGSRSRSGMRSPRPACIRGTPRSASCCGRRRCCTTSAPPSTTTTTTSIRAT